MHIYTVYTLISRYRHANSSRNDLCAKWIYTDNTSDLRQLQTAPACLYPEMVCHRRWASPRCPALQASLTLTSLWTLLQPSSSLFSCSKHCKPPQMWGVLQCLQWPSFDENQGSCKGEYVHVQKVGELLFWAGNGDVLSGKDFRMRIARLCTYRCMPLSRDHCRCKSQNRILLFAETSVQ